MSVRLTAAAWRVQCSPTHKLVLLALADHANDDQGICWPSISHIEEKTGLNRRTVTRSLESLESEQIIKREHRGRQTTIYHLRITGWGQSAPKGHKTPSVGAHDPYLGAHDPYSGGTQPLEVGAQCHVPRGTVPPGTITEPSMGTVSRTINESSGNQQGAQHSSAPPVDNSANGSGNGKAQPRTAERFDEFWQLYPSRRAKKRAREIWQTKKLDERADEILHDVRERQRRDQRWLNGYIPNPTTYLNQERWEDELSAPVGRGARTNSEHNAEVMQRWLEETEADPSILGGGQ